MQHLLAKAPRDRYASAQEVRKALTAAITFPNSPALEPTRAEAGAAYVVVPSRVFEGYPLAVAEASAK